jgi:hypothetical protein
MMAEVHFTTMLRDHVPNGPLAAPGETVRQVLAGVVAEYPHLRTYILDDQGRLRKHMCVFVDGERLANTKTLDHSVRPDSKLYVMQALSGG